MHGTHDWWPANTEGDLAYCKRCDVRNNDVDGDHYLPCPEAPTRTDLPVLTPDQIADLEATPLPELAETEPPPGGWPW
jgi:hypothetical protein